MKVCLIKASGKSSFKDYKKSQGTPTQNIFSSAAAMPAGVKLEMYDETSGGPANMKTKAEIVGIFASTPDAIRMYELADAFRSKGKTVVLGGLHASFLPDEASEHADAVLIGESEGLWDELLDDYVRGGMKPLYERSEPLDLSTLNRFPTDVVDPAIYKGVWSVLVSRGCGYNCAFCTVRPFSGAQRWRPIQDVVDEVRACGSEWVELHSDNLTFDREYALQLFKALKPLGRYFIGETTINIADDEELLDAAADCGMSYMLFGLETPSASALKGVGKGFVSVDKVKGQIQKIHDRKIMVDSCMLFGLDGQDEGIFEQTLEFTEEVDVDVVAPVIVTPYPGTRLFKKLEDEGRILTRDWSKYDGSHAVFQPKGMSPEALEEGTEWFVERYYETWRYTKRKMRQVKRFGVGMGLFSGY